MRVILQTERLILRELEEGDIPDLREMLQDRRVMYAYGHDFSDEDVRAWYERQQRRYATLGFASGRRWKGQAARWLAKLA